MRRIAIVGGPCLGKTTLAGTLAEEIGATFVPEAAYGWHDRHWRWPRSVADCLDLMLCQVAVEDACPDPVIITDTATWVEKVYASALGPCALLSVAARVSAGRYDLQVMPPRVFPYVQEGRHCAEPEARRLDLAIEHLACAWQLPLFRLSHNPDEWVGEIIKELT